MITEQSQRRAAVSRIVRIGDALWTAVACIVCVATVLAAVPRGVWAPWIPAGSTGDAWRATLVRGASWLADVQTGAGALLWPRDPVEGASLVALGLSLAALALLAAAMHAAGLTALLAALLALVALSAPFSAWQATSPLGAAPLTCLSAATLLLLTRTTIGMGKVGTARRAVRWRWAHRFQLLATVLSVAALSWLIGWVAGAPSPRATLALVRSDLGAIGLVLFCVGFLWAGVSWRATARRWRATARVAPTTDAQAAREPTPEGVVGQGGGGPHSADDAHRRDRFGVRPSTFDLRRSVFGVRRLAFSVRRSAFSISGPVPAVAIGLCVLGLLSTPLAPELRAALVLPWVWWLVAAGLANVLAWRPAHGVRWAVTGLAIWVALHAAALPWGQRRQEAVLVRTWADGIAAHVSVIGSLVPEDTALGRLVLARARESDGRARSPSAPITSVVLSAHTRERLRWTGSAIADAPASVGVPLDALLDALPGGTIVLGAISADAASQLTPPQWQALGRIGLRLPDGGQPRAHVLAGPTRARIGALELVHADRATLQMLPGDPLGRTSARAPVDARLEADRTRARILLRDRPFLDVQGLALVFFTTRGDLLAWRTGDSPAALSGTPLGAGPAQISEATAVFACLNVAPEQNTDVSALASEGVLGVSASSGAAIDVRVVRRAREAGAPLRKVRGDALIPEAGNDRFQGRAGPERPFGIDLRGHVVSATVRADQAIRVCGADPIAPRLDLDQGPVEMAMHPRFAAQIGTGWHDSEPLGGGRFFRWMAGPRATILLHLGGHADDLKSLADGRTSPTATPWDVPSPDVAVGLVRPAATGVAVGLVRPAATGVAVGLVRPSATGVAVGLVRPSQPDGGRPPAFAGTASAGRQGSSLRFTLDAQGVASPGPGDEVRLEVNGHLVAAHPLMPTRGLYEWDVPADLLRAGLNTFLVETTQTLQPAAVQAGADRRLLGLAVHGWTVAPGASEKSPSRTTPP